MVGPESAAWGAPQQPHGRSDARRDELARAAFAVLGRQGYAGTSLRDVAQSSRFSLGVVHYYFTDKTALLLHGLALYRAHAATRYDDLMVAAGTARELADRWAERLAEVLVEEHGLDLAWYDLRLQSLFDENLRPDVAATDKSLEELVWRLLERYAALAGRAVAVPAPAAYAMLDGLVQHALAAHHDGDAEAAGLLVDRVGRLLPSLLVPGPAAKPGATEPGPRVP